MLNRKRLCRCIIFRYINMVDSFQAVLLARHPFQQHIIEIIYSVIGKGKNSFTYKRAVYFDSLIQ